MNREQKKANFRFLGEQVNLFQGNKGTGTTPTPWEGLDVRKDGGEYRSGSMLSDHVFVFNIYDLFAIFAVQNVTLSK